MHICVYIYIDRYAAVKLLSGHYLGQVGVIIWAKVILRLVLQWFQALFGTVSYHFVFGLSYQADKKTAKLTSCKLLSKGQTKLEPRWPKVKLMKVKL